MTEDDSAFHKLFGISDCDLISTQESIENGKCYKTVHLKCSGNTLLKCSKRGDKTYSYGYRNLRALLKNSGLSSGSVKTS